MHPIEKEVAHRPFPIAQGPWVMFQSWRQLLFAHWPVPLAELRALVPRELDLEEYGGTGWIGLTPFRVANMHARFLPAVPGISEFPEMNLRTYVRVRGVPGIYFFSLDAGSRLAVLGARMGYRLPYFEAEMRMESRGGWIHYSSRREQGEAEFHGRYRPVGPAVQAQRGTLEYFLIERYALYTVLSNGSVLRGHIHHGPWAIQPAEAEIERNTVAAVHGVTLPHREPLVHYAERQDTLVWPPMKAK